MAIVINGSGTVSGLAVGGLPDDSVDAGSLANSINSEITANTAKTGITSSQATAITAALPIAGGSVTGDVNFGDNVKAKFGDANDLNIYHNGTHSIIQDSGSGDLKIWSSKVEIQSPDAGENIAIFNDDGAVELYHNNAKKIETTATGVTVTGAIAGATNLGKITKVTMAYNSSTRSAFGYTRDLFARNNEMVGHKVGFSFVKDSASTDIMVVFSMQVAKMRDCYQCATYSGTNYSSTFFKRFAFSGSVSIGNNSVTTGMTITGTAIYTAAELNSTGTKNFYWAMGRPNDGYNSSYILNPNTTEDAMYGGATTSTITVYEGDFT